MCCPTTNDHSCVKLPEGMPIPMFGSPGLDGGWTVGVVSSSHLQSSKSQDIPLSMAELGTVLHIMCACMYVYTFTNIDSLLGFTPIPKYYTYTVG